ncbi:hypothetical protein [Microcoleus sp. F4-D5]|uniref:hypothetical protein n=1 Tax=Microcoleus sp. F4-D5 TaxID=2818760 RepID=UPI002FCFD1FF
MLINRSDLGDGDGTVPKISAIPIERSENLDNFFIAEQHGGLQNQAQVLENLLNNLRFSRFDLGSVRGSEPQTAISLSLDDLYLADEAITLRAKLIGLPDSATKLKANIQAVSHEQAALTLDFVEQEKEWMVAIADLQPGLYRVTVQTENSSDRAPTPVRDLFEVVNKSNF